MEVLNKSKNNTNGLSLAVVVSFLFAIVNKISEDITFTTSSGEASINFGIFVPASAAIIFGKGVGSTAAGLGGLLTEIQNALFTDQSSGLDSDVLITSLANFLGAFITGYLAKTTDAKPTQLSSFIKNRSIWGRIIQNTGASIIGMSMMANFSDVYANQINSDVTTEESTLIFLSKFFESAIVLILSIPVLLLLFEWFERVLFKRGIKFDLDGRNINWEVADPGDAEIESVTLPDHAFFRNIWTKVELKFKNKTGRESSFSIEGVSNVQIYPHLDSSKRLQPDESWVQTFYVLPSKLETLELRFRVTPTVEKKFKAPIVDDAIVNVSARILDPTKNQFGILQFSGVNFSVLGFGIIWQDIVDAFNNPGGILDNFRGNTEILGLTAIIETILVLPFVYLIYRRERSKGMLEEFHLAFSQDLESHGYEEKARKIGLRILYTYQRIFFRLFQVLITLSTLLSIGYLGFEGYNVWNTGKTKPLILSIGDQTILEVSNNSDYVLIATSLVLIAWIFALKGMEAINTFGMKRIPSWVLKPGEVILDFKPVKQFQEGIASDVIITAQNPTNKSGLRIVFQGQDTISPPMVELHASPGEIVNFKIAVTPLHRDTSDILAVVYPFFDEEENLLDFDETEPIARQDIHFVTSAQTKLGITQNQQQKLFRVGGVGAIIGVAVTFLNQLFPNYPEIGELIKQNGPYIAMLQAPFLYIYFYYQNKLKGSKTRF